MEKSLKIMTVLVIAVLLFVPSISMASIQDTDTKINDLYYRILSENNKTVELTGIYNSEFKSRVDVPSSVEIQGKTYTVISIGNYAFPYSSTLKSITLPNSITSIGDEAFIGCSSLKSITLPNGITNIGSGTFTFCSSLTSIILPNSITSIGDEAFDYCSALTSITLPSKITSIGNESFRNCRALISITLPNSITQINRETFAHCTNLEKVIIPKSVEAIALNAFENCEKVVINTYSGAYAETFAKENNIKYKLLDVAEPEPEKPTTQPENPTKVGYVTIGGTGNTLTGAEIPNTDNIYTEMKAILNEKGFKTVHCAYELSATGDDIKNGVELTFDVGTKNNGKQAMILHKKSNGEYEEFIRTVENGKVKITVTEFSPFMVAVAETKPNGVNSQGSATTNTDNAGNEKETETTEQTPTDTNNTENENKTETEKKSIGATTVQATTDNEPKTGTTDYTVIATILAIVSLAGIIVLKLKK